MIPRCDLLGLPERTAAKISANGLYLSWLAPVASVMNIWIAPRGALDKGEPLTHLSVRGIQSYTWALDGRHLLYLQDNNGDENSQIFAIDIETRSVRNLTPFPGVRCVITQLSRRRRGSVLVSMNERDRRFFDLHTIDLISGDIQRIEDGTGISYFATDDDFVARLAVRATANGGSVIDKRDTDGRWAAWIEIPPEDATNTQLLTLNADGTMLYIKDSRGRDKAALLSIDIATSTTVVLADDPLADIGAVLGDLESHEPIGYWVNHLIDVAYPLSSKVSADFALLDSHELGTWRVQNRSDDDRFWVIGAFSDIRPDRAYVLDRDKRELTLLYDARPILAHAELVPMRPVLLRARDGLGLVSYLTLPHQAGTAPSRPDVPLPLVLVVHGGPWSRDIHGFNATHQWLANRGYAALSVNFRGSTGFGKLFVEAAVGEWGGRMDEDLLDAVDWAVSEGIADPSRIGIFGGSYGGYAVLSGMTRTPSRFACGIDLFGPSDLQSLLAATPAYWESFRTKQYRSIGDPRSEAGRAFLKARSPLHNAASIKSPLLIAQGANDPRVPPAESKQMVDELERNQIPVTYLFFPDEGHGFGRPDNNLAFIAIAEAFLSRHLGGRAEPIDPSTMARSSIRIVTGSHFFDEQPWGCRD